VGNDRVKFLILGAGPTGLGAGYRLKELEVNDFLILDRSDRAGGLAASYEDPQGFTWDFGGHVHYSHYNYYDQALGRIYGDENWYKHLRNSQIIIKGRFVPYPFQNNIHALSFADQFRCLRGLLWSLIRRHFKPTHSFIDWIRNYFGSGMADLFLIPYNSKVWAHSLEEIDGGWMGDRVPSANFLNLLMNTLAKRDATSWGPNQYFRFPKKGGTGSVWNAMKNYLEPRKVRLNTDIESIDPKFKIVESRQGRFGYDFLISTIPLKGLVQLTNDMPDEVKKASNSLKYSSIHVIGIGIKGEPPGNLKKIGWMYFPDSNVPFYRATVLSNYSPFCVPRPGKTWSLQIEVSESAFLKRDGKNLVDLTIRSLVGMGFINEKEDIISTWHKRSEYGYPTPTLGRNEALGIIQEKLKSLGIYSRGRFGGWKYEVSNQDHSFMQGVEIINFLVSGEREKTYPSPGLVNTGRKV